MVTFFRKILKFLIPVKLSIGVLPRRTLLEKYNLLEVCISPYSYIMGRRLCNAIYVVVFHTIFSNHKNIYLLVNKSSHEHNLLLLLRLNLDLVLKM
jgi:hypothetical protein